VPEPRPTERVEALASPLRAALFVGGAGAAFATSGPLAAWAKPAHPLLIAFGRTALAALLLALVNPKALARSIAALDARARMRAAAAGLILAAHFGLFVWGLARTSLAAAVSLVSLEPLSVVLWAFALHRLQPTRGEQLGVLLATGGAIVVARGAGIGEHRLDGDLIVLGAVALFGLYVGVARYFRGVLPAGQYAAIVYGVSALACAAALAVLPGGASSWRVPPHSAIAIVALALVPTLVGHTAVQAAARVASPSLVALVSPVETLGGLVIAATIFHAPPAASDLAGAAIIVAGATLAILGRGSA
jgi:drug/metabolite transporter (DMT)-like permease